MVTKNGVKKEDAQVEKATSEHDVVRVSRVPDDFKRWANDVRETQSLRDRRMGRGSVGGGARWWSLVPDDLRVFLLSTVTPDDWERYMRSTWQALPEGLRSELASRCRNIERVVQGCPWR